MDNKLQQLTDKLYAEGLEKGKAQGATIVEQAKAEAAEIIKQAQQKAAAIEAQAKTNAEELARNTASEVRSVSLQTISALKAQIENFILSSIVTDQVSAAYADGSLTRELIVKALESWKPSQDNPVEVIVPESYIDQIKSHIGNKFNHGVEVIYDGKMHVPFRISPSEGSYYVSFSDEDFNLLIQSALRAHVSQFLFSK